MNTDYDITTKEKVKSLLGITGTTNDALLTMLIRQVTAMVAGEIGLRLKDTEYTEELYDGGEYGEVPRNYIVLRSYPVTDFSAIEYKGGTETVPVWTTIDPNYYTRNDKYGTLYSHGGFIRGFQNIRVTYQAGYLIDFGNEGDAVLHTLPFDITMVATELVAKKFQLRNAQGIANESTEGQSITYARGVEGTLSDEQKNILARYTRNIIA